MPERDPRVDPRPSDVVIFGPQWQRSRYEVASIDQISDVVWVRIDGSRNEVPYLLGQWRKWAKDAEVIR